ncbi:MAG: hypothetical protein PF542_06050 [Nanoarchaeota archaeon]|jgi:hypothetical protein|nr:hypothetical protein [Nanoarchaeota archaeon]
MNFIKKIVDKKEDSLTHLQFQKFSKGIFKNRAVLKVKKTKNKYSIGSTGEFINEMVRIVAKKAGDNKMKVTGAVIATSDLTGKIDFNEKKQFQGVKRYLLSNEMSGNEVISLLNEFPKAIFALSFEFGDDKLKIKPKAPKMGVPGKGEEAPKTDACKLTTTDAAIGESFVFEKKDFKLAEINHIFTIDKITLPETEEKDFSKIRAMAGKSGKIERTAVIDGEKTVVEYPFECKPESN